MKAALHIPFGKIVQASNGTTGRPPFEDRPLAAKNIIMKLLTEIEQINACLKHANRKGLTIDHFERQPRGGDNHTVIAWLPDEPDGRPYFSVAILINVKNDTFIGCNESTWDVGRN